jgi:hypothetical protein
MIDARQITRHRDTGFDPWNEMQDPGESEWAKAFRWLIGSVVAIVAAALFYVLVIDPSIVAVAPFALGCLLEFIRGQGCAP